MTGRLVRAVVALLLVAGPAAAAELVMFKAQGCGWCQIWESQIGILYDKTDEARRLPLRRVDIGDPRPEDLRALRPVTFTPTFVVVEKGREIGRIPGYPGEEFFWAAIAQFLSKLDK